MSEPTGKKTMEQLLDRWMNDPSFKDQLRSDPKTTLKSYGIDATDDMVKSLKAVSSNASVEELKERVVKWGMGAGSGI